MLPSTAKPARADVTFCAIDRVGAQAFLVVCTTLDWRVYRLDRFSAARDSLTPVQVVLDDSRDGALLSNVRMLRLFRLPAAPSPRSGAASPQLGGLFVSERCDEVDYSHVGSHSDAAEASVAPTDSSEDLAIFSFTHERILKRLPPTPSSVVDVQIQRTTAAVLCESHEILLVDLQAMCVQQRIASLASLAMALGPRWIAYPGLSPSLLDDDDDSDDGDEFVPEALVHGGSRQLLSAAQSRSASVSSASTPPAYNAIDVAQNVASGIYFLSKSIAPYLSTSPGTQPHTASIDQQTSQHNQQTALHHTQNQQTASTQNQQTAQTQHQHNAQHAGWVVVQDLRTGRVVANFQCHATALLHLAFDFSGSLLATSSTKGQNVHVFRLLPPLSTTSSGSRASGVAGPTSRHQLLYKLQRGITHASIADLAFSQDAKWLSVTSAHGTSHLYAIHPEGAAMSPHTHATDASSRNGADDHSAGRSGAVRDRDVSDFCAGMRVVEPKTLARVLKIHHTLQATAVAATNVTPYGSLGASSTASAFYYQTPPTTLMNTALDASQALFSQLAQSTGIDFSSGYDEQDIASRRRRRRRRMSCLFAHDGLKMAIYCDGTLKLYDLKVHLPVVPAVSGRSLRSALGGGSSSELLVKTRSSPFGFDATVSELKSWELSDASRVRTESLSSGLDEGPSTSDLAASGRPRTSELRTFVQRGLPLWAHPKVSFRVIDHEHPEGLVLQIKRKGPSNMELGGDGLLHGGDDQQLFVMEMDSYFGLGGSPVFTGQSDQRVVPEVPRLDLAESMNLAISTSIKTPKYKSISVTVGKPVAPELTEDEHGTPVTRRAATRKNKKNAKHTAKTVATRTTGSSDGDGDNDAGVSSDSSSTSTSASSSPTILQFTLQDMYFALPNGTEAE